MNLKKIISAVSAGVLAASIGVSAFAAAPTATWLNGTNLITEGGKSATSTGTLSEAIITNATIEFDLLLKGFSGDASYLTLKSGEKDVISIKRIGWSSKSYTVDEKEVIKYSSSDQEKDVAAHHFVITLDFAKNIYAVQGTKTEGNVGTVTGTFTADSIDSLKLYAANSSYGGNEAAITNLSITTQDITNAVDYSNTNDTELNYPDAKGFTADFTVEDGKVIDSLTWYLKNNEGAWKKLTTGELPKITSGNIKVGLIVYDLPDGVTAEDISAGYTYTSSVQTVE